MHTNQLITMPRPNKRQVAPTASEQQQDAALQDGRIEWAKQMRLAFSPGGMLFEDGTINQAFFKPKMVRGSSQLLHVGSVVMMEQPW